MVCGDGRRKQRAGEKNHLCNTREGEEAFFRWNRLGGKDASARTFRRKGVDEPSLKRRKNALPAIVLGGGRKRGVGLGGEKEEPRK